MKVKWVGELSVVNDICTTCQGTDRIKDQPNPRCKWRLTVDNQDEDHNLQLITTADQVLMCLQAGNTLNQIVLKEPPIFFWLCSIIIFTKQLSMDCISLFIEQVLLVVIE